MIKVHLEQKEKDPKELTPEQVNDLILEISENVGGVLILDLARNVFLQAIDEQTEEILILPGLSEGG
ncbi:MAG: hypothetical protein QXQ64_06790 [Candidatus Bathyarchaeia archaeon]